jgi:hypothetical protein
LSVTNFDVGIDYLTPAMGQVPYWFWPPSLDFVPDSVGAYAIDEPAPDIQDVINGGEVTVEGVDMGLGFQRGMFCAAVINLIRRANRKIVPTLGDDRYDGGTWACQNFWAPFAEDFSIFSVYPPGTLIGRYFRWAGDPGFSAVVDQGHVAVLWDEHNLAEQKDAWVVQSHPDVGGLDWNVHLTKSHAGWYYEYAVRPENWINHDKGGF